MKPRRTKAYLEHLDYRALRDALQAALDASPVRANMKTLITRELYEHTRYREIEAEFEEYAKEDADEDV